jgi:hypothetical protein
VSNSRHKKATCCLTGIVLRIPPTDDVLSVSMHLDCRIVIRNGCVGKFDVPFSNIRRVQLLCNLTEERQTQRKCYLQSTFAKMWGNQGRLLYVTVSVYVTYINHLTPNGHFSGRIAPLTYRCCIFYLFNKYTYWIF